MAGQGEVGVVRLVWRGQPGNGQVGMAGHGRRGLRCRLGFHDWRMVGEKWFEPVEPGKVLGFWYCRMNCRRPGCVATGVFDYDEYFWGYTDEVR
jgi:hypothetical protein